MQMKKLDLSEIKKVISYNPNTGEFIRLISHRNVKVGDIAGSRIESSQKPGKFYIRIGILGTFIWAHRLAFAIMTGNWPIGEIDHIDQNSENNRWLNLRECSKQVNAKNMSVYKSNKTGYPGISIRPNGKYRARIMHEGHSISLGDWNTPEQALAARMVAKKEYNFHENHC